MTPSAPLRNAPSPIPTTLRFMAARLAHRLRGGARAASLGTFRKRVDRALAEVYDLVLRHDWIEVDARNEGWTDTGLMLESGRAVTLLAEGRVLVSSALDVGFGPQVGLWHRVGDGDLDKILGRASTLRSDRPGSLYLTTKPGGEFADRRGAFDPAIPRSGLSGSFLVCAIQWRRDPAVALTQAATVDAELFGPALKRLQAPVLPPPGWHYLWRLGAGEIYSECGADHALCCHTQADVGILQFSLRRPLRASTRLSWDWKVDQLPSTLPEHLQPTHDYLSVAVEFDNGLDLTWMWSCELPVDTVFQCPLPWWDQRETHWVVRSGTQQLGQWLGERRDLLADYERAIGGPPPKHIVGVWLIANTAFQRGEGRCEYRGIRIEDEAGEVRVQG